MSDYLWSPATYVGDEEVAIWYVAVGNVVVSGYAESAVRRVNGWDDWDNPIAWSDELARDDVDHLIRIAGKPCLGRNDLV